MSKTTVAIVSLAMMCVASTCKAELANTGFEDVVPVDPLPLASYGIWGGDTGAMVTAENGITPLEGSRMFKFTEADPNANTWQVVDVSSYAPGTTFTFSAYFNRPGVNGAPQAVNDFTQQLRIAAIDHAPPISGVDLSAGTLNELNQAVPYDTWTKLSIDGTIPAGTVALGVQVGTSGLGAYVDQTELVPEPSAFVLGTIGLLCLGWFGWRRKRKAA